MENNFYLRWKINYQNSIPVDEQIVKIVDENGGWDMNHGQLCMKHDDDKTLYFGSNVGNSGWVTVIMTKPEYLKLKSVMTDRYFNNSSVSGVPYGAEVERIAKYHFIYNEKEYSGHCISATEIRKTIKDLQEKLKNTLEFKSLCGLE
jgi:hypothetical protein